MKFGSSYSCWVTELATRISRALISESNPTRSWSPLAEKTLHRLRCRDSLTPCLVAKVIDPFLLSHHSLALGFFNWASQQPGFSHSSISYQSIIASLSTSRHFNAIDSLLRQAKAQKVSLNSSVYGYVIASLLTRGKSLNAFLLFREACSVVDGNVGSEICNSLLASMASDGHFENARKVFDEMSQRGVFFNTVGFGVFIWKLCGSVELSVVLGLFDEIRGRDSEINGSIIALLVVHGLCKALRVSEAFVILDELRSRNFKPDFMAYRTVTEAFRSTGSQADIEMVLKKKRKLGVAPRTNDYKDFILRLISERRIFEAKEIGEVIVSGNFPIEMDVLSTLIESVSAIDTDTALVFLRFMVSKDNFPTLLTLDKLSNNLCKHSKIDELLEMFQLLSSHDYFEELESYNVMVLYLCRAGKLREAYGVLREMKKKGLGPDIVSYNSLMEACCRDDLLRPAKRLWDEMFASGLYGNLQTYNILIRKMSEVGQIEEARRLFSHMAEKGVLPDYTTYTSLLQGLCQERKLEDAFEILNQALKQDLLLGQNVLNTYILNLCKEGLFLSASQLLCQLDCGITGSYSHVILLKCLAEASEVPLALTHITWLRETSSFMMQVISDALSMSLSSSSKLEPIIQLVRAAKGDLNLKNEVTKN